MSLNNPGLGSITDFKFNPPYHINTHTVPNKLMSDSVNPAVDSNSATKHTTIASKRDESTV